MYRLGRWAGGEVGLEVNVGVEREWDWAWGVGLGTGMGCNARTAALINHDYRMPST